MTSNFEPFSAPGALIRRLQQISVRVFQEGVSPYEISTIQYGALEAVAAHPGIDQISLSLATDIDRTTVVRIIDRLEADGLVQRTINPANRRANVLFVTVAGKKLLERVSDLATASQIKLLSPLTAADRKAFMRMLLQLVSSHSTDGKRKVPLVGRGPLAERCRSEARGDRQGAEG